MANAATHLTARSTAGRLWRLGVRRYISQPRSTSELEFMGGRHPVIWSIDIDVLPDSGSTLGSGVQTHCPYIPLSAYIAGLGPEAVEQTLPERAQQTRWRLV